MSDTSAETGITSGLTNAAIGSGPFIRAGVTFVSRADVNIGTPSSPPSTSFPTPSRSLPWYKRLLMWARSIFHV